MRAVLTLALVLLVLVVLLRVLEAPGGPPGASRGATAHALHVVAAARGHLLPPGRLGSGEEELDSALRIGEMDLPLAAEVEGLRVALVGADLGLAVHSCYDVARDAEDARAFVALAGDQPAGTLAVIASKGRIAPPEEAAARRADLLRAARALGARADPFTRDARAPASWALVSLRRPEGWVALAEGIAHGSGVVVAFSVAQDRSLYDPQRGFRGDLVRQRPGQEVRLDLVAELDACSAHSPLVREHLGVPGPTPSTVADVAPRGTALLFPLRLRAPRMHARWEDLWLGDAPRLASTVRLEPDPRGLPSGAAVTVSVDGREVLREVLRADGREPALATVDLDLGAFAGRKVVLELAAERLEGAKRPPVLFEHPTVRYAPTD